MVLCSLVCTVFIACDPCAFPVRPNHLRSTESSQTIPPLYNLSGTFQLSLVLLGLVISVCSTCVSNLKVRYLPYDTNLSTLGKSLPGTKTPPPFYVILLILLVSINSYHINLAMLFHFSFDFYPLVAILFKFRRRFSRSSPFFLVFESAKIGCQPGIPPSLFTNLLRHVFSHFKESTNVGFPSVSLTF